MCSRPMKCGRWNKKKEKKLTNIFETTRNLHLINCLDRYLVHNFRFIETQCALHIDRLIEIRLWHAQRCY